MYGGQNIKYKQSVTSINSGPVLSPLAISPVHSTIHAHTSRGYSVTLGYLVSDALCRETCSGHCGYLMTSRLKYTMNLQRGGEG
jgi:hypothetical protein